MVTTAQPMKGLDRAENSHAKKSKYGTVFDPHLTQSLLQPEGNEVKRQFEHQSAGGSDSSSPKNDPVELPRHWNQHDKLTGLHHTAVIKGGKQSIEKLSQARLGSLHEAKELLKEGTPPTMKDYDIKGLKDNSAYKESVRHLESIAPTSKLALKDTTDHLRRLENHPARDKLLPQAKQVEDGLTTAHTWTSKHPHDRTNDHEFVMGMHHKVKDAKIAEIEAEELQVASHMAKHMR
jgi:hypothetical protein